MAKSLRSQNPINVVRATIEALRQLAMFAPEQEEVPEESGQEQAASPMPVEIEEEGSPVLPATESGYTG